MIVEYQKQIELYKINVLFKKLSIPMLVRRLSCTEPFVQVRLAIECSFLLIITFYH